MAHTLHIQSGVFAGDYTKDTIEELEKEVSKFGIGASIEETVSALRSRGNIVHLMSDPVVEVEAVEEVVEPVKVKKTYKKKVK